MIEPDHTQLAVELQPEFLDDQGRRHFLVGADGRLLTRLVAAEANDELRVAVDDDGPAMSVAEWQGLLLAVIGMARAERRSRVVLPVGSQLLLRYVARASGFGGPLRGALSLSLDPPALPTMAPGAGAGAPEDRFLADLNSLLPGTTVTAAKRPAGWLRSALRSASAGVAGTIHFTVNDGSGIKPLWVAAPLNDDVMAECVAMAVDTAMAIRRRFHPHVDGVRMFFDQSIHGLRSGEIAGLAEAYVRDVHLNPAFALARELEVLDRQRQERRSARSPEQVARRGPITVLPPFTRVDSVVAHEFWHQIEFGFESGQYRNSVEFRRAVGGYFGVETLEHVLKGGAPHAAPEWRIARARLAAEVSDYATTNPKEATAELFTQWWCTRADPPPSARFFGEVMERFFPLVR
jgi:hypothetical protein